MASAAKAAKTQKRRRGMARYRDTDARFSKMTARKYGAFVSIIHAFVTG